MNNSRQIRVFFRGKIQLFNYTVHPSLLRYAATRRCISPIFLWDFYNFVLFVFMLAWKVKKWFIRQTDRQCRGLFHPFLDTLCLHFRSEGRAKAEWKQGEGRVCPPSVIIIPKKPKNRVPLLRKKKWHKVAPDDNNNYNKYETTVNPHFTLQLTNCKANTTTDSCICSDVQCLIA